jgi:Flp pilus assembly protein TadG
MRPPFIKRPRRGSDPLSRESGVTLALVALSIVSIVAMAALSIDVGTLYEASAEAQRSADAAALAGARSLSINGLTSDPTNKSAQWSNACTAATQMAQAEAAQNLVSGAAPATPTVTFLASDGSDCTTGSGAFGVNPMVTVKVQQPKVYTFFARVFGLFNSNWKSTSVSATATAEVFNPSGSENYSGGTLVPVQPRCVKPWLIPNLDPDHGASTPFVTIADGSIQTSGISVPGNLTTAAYAVGELLTLMADCQGNGAPCIPIVGDNPPVSPATGQLQYVPGLVPASSVGVPSCANGTPYQQAIAGCDQTTVYQCGVPWASSAAPNQVDLTENPNGGAGDTAVGAECLTNQLSGATDTLDTTVYPYQIHAGAGNPLGVSGAVITSSNSIVTLPIIENKMFTVVGEQANVTIVGFLQVFIKNIDPFGNVNVIVLNVAGCGNGTTNTVGTSPLTGTSPVPVRLITPP